MSKPDYNAVVSQRKSDDKNVYTQIGVAWHREKNGKKYVSVKLNTRPFDWDGSFALFPNSEE